MKISMTDIFGIRCIALSDGQRLHDMIIGELKDGKRVTLDFSGIKQFASPFFNLSIGQIMTEISEGEFRKLLSLENLDETGIFVVEQVISNASKYHADADYKKIVDEILDRQAKGEDEA
ncbi:STAS-like domain-containing protein [Pseudomonas poae]|uniref:STAS-like domain-containing protein n=1 Tax=Pseudomonas poae TaxID=200451 RepID=UPI0034D3D432